jgi:hypothetical protein
MKHFLVLVTLLFPLVASAAPTDDVIAAMKKADQAKMVLDINAGDAARASSNLGKQGTELAAACNDAVDKAIAAGSTDKTILLVDGYQKVALGTVKPDHCAPLAELAKSFDAKTAAAKDDRDAKLSAPFIAAGITGDKLAWAIRWSKNDYDFYGVGGAILKPAELKKASVVFLITGDADHAWALHRYSFKGDKSSGETQEGFKKRPGATKFR